MTIDPSPDFSADIVARARGWIGTPYRHQASLRTVGCDCLGLVRGVWRELYGAEAGAVPAYTRDWAEASGAETLLSAARRFLVEIDVEAAGAGDVVVFRYRPGIPAKHVGILCGAGRFIHAIENGPVAEVALSGWWRRRITAAFAFPRVDR